MKSVRRISIAAAIAMSILLTPTSAWASRDETVSYLFQAALNQSELLYYAGIGDYYSAYSYAAASYQNLYNAWLYAPVGSAMESWAGTAYQHAYEAQSNWYHTYLYGWSYEWYALYYSYLAQLYTAYAQYGAAFYF